MDNFFQKPLENFDTSRAQPHFLPQNRAGRGDDDVFGVGGEAAEIYKSDAEGVAIVKVFQLAECFKQNSNLFSRKSRR